MTDYRLITFDSAEGPRAGIVVDDRFMDAATATGRPQYSSVLAILDDWDGAEPQLAQAAVAAGDWHPLGGATLLAPVHYPVTIYCAGANYSDHVERISARMGMPPEPDPRGLGLKPWHFIKPSRTAVGDRAVVSCMSAALDWEIELAAVIGRTTRNVSVADALHAVAGYTVANDLSARDLFRRPHGNPASPFALDWIGQKVFDGSCPLGPALVPARQVGDPQALQLRLTVNGKVKQDSSTARMIFTLAEQVAHLSTRVTLHPGDVLLTGTPAGTGAETGDRLSGGDVVVAEIEKLGRLTTTIGSVAPA